MKKIEPYPRRQFRGHLQMFPVIGEFCEKINLIKVFDTAIRSYIVIIFWDFNIDFASEANGEILLIALKSSWL